MKEIFKFKMNNIVFGDEQLDKYYHMKNSISNRPQRIALPGLVLSSKGGYRSGS
jgi:hypothetical protein